MENQKKFRVLQMNIDNQGNGGAYVLIRRIEKEFEINHPDIIFDYLTMQTFDNNSNLEMRKESRIFNANLRKNRLIGHIRLPFYVYSILKKEKYSVVHINSEMSWKMLLYAIPARIAGVERVILHAHSTGIDGGYKLIKRICQLIATPLLKFFSDDLLACSSEAANYVFGKKLCSRKGYIVVKNGIDTERFKYSEDKRKKIRESLGIKDEDVLIGNTSRIAYQKNPLFLAKIFSVIHNIIPNAKLIYVGGGDEKYIKIVKEYIHENNIDEFVAFLGHIDSVDEILCALDVFVFPSLFEGLGISLIEAQTCGLPCVISNTIPPIASITEGIKVLSLNDSEEIWAEEIIDCVGKRVSDAKETVDRTGFNVKKTAEEMYNIYMRIGEKSNVK